MDFKGGSLPEDKLRANMTPCQVARWPVVSDCRTYRFCYFYSFKKCIYEELDILPNKLVLSLWAGLYFGEFRQQGSF